jgi:Mn-dependent DtxR family transcriptional regulator
VRLTPRGAEMAENIAHRHDDLVAFLELVLGLPRDKAEADACRLEHGLSPLAAERLHAFLDHIESLPARTRNRMLDSIHGGRRKPAFLHLAEVKTPGWRG